MSEEMKACPFCGSEAEMGAYLAPDGLGAAASSIREALEEPAL